MVLEIGFIQSPGVPMALAHVSRSSLSFDPMTTSYFLSRKIEIPTVGDGMAAWREKIFATMHRSASTAAEHLFLPTNSVVEFGSKAEI